MTSFLEFLRARGPSEGFSTEDALACFLPLAKRVLEIHQSGQVAPLVGVDHIVVEDGQLSFRTPNSTEVKSGDSRRYEFQAYWSSPIDVVSESETVDGENPEQQVEKTLDVVGAHQDLERPVYRAGYVSWEHAIDIHDPATDIYVLGLILASLACNLDLSPLEKMELWVTHRKHLFKLNPDLHPYLAQTIFRMTHLDRQQRSQDLPGLIYGLENYRDQTTDLQFDLSAIPGFQSQDQSSRQQLIFARLRERLFDLTRRNRLLHFQENLQAVNLTQGSVPLSSNLKELRPGQIMTWSDELSKQVADGKAISLNRHLNFDEAVYLPPLLDRLIADSRRDLAEFGFVQLRLVAVFLKWANLKETPNEIYSSPLILIPVKLKKNKGIRDTYELIPQSEMAEVNPVIRHMFQQLYAIRLPEHIDLTAAGLDSLFEVLEKQIQATEPAVELQLVDRPQFEIVHERARRKLEQYRRRARKYGRGQRTYSDLEYSYDPANYQPLGIQLFRQYVDPGCDHDGAKAVASKLPQAPVGKTQQADGHRRSHARFKSKTDDNPYRWTFDQCNLTLANFKYRKMSLVRDYDALIEGVGEHRVFDDIFSTETGVPQRLPKTPALERRSDILPCDPTQATAIARAREGESYIIQGPPGTGKSQTIANLIADYISRGKRVLFVCEKRAAIDVVYARLKQCGIGDLACLIHDTQADKRDFVHDLRDGFEGLVNANRVGNRRAGGRSVVRRLLRELEPLEAFNRLMLQCNHQTGIPVREVLERKLKLRSTVPAINREDISELDVSTRERLPDFSEWYTCREPLDRLQRWSHYGNQGESLATHPFRFLRPEITEQDEPINLVSSGCQRANSHIADLFAAFAQAKHRVSRWPTVESMGPMIRWCEWAAPLAESGQLGLLIENSERDRWWKKTQAELQRCEKELQHKQVESENWQEPLSRSDAEIAVEQATRYEANGLRWLLPGWWKLRKQMNLRYRFSAHAVRPSYSQVLQKLIERYEAQQSLDRKYEEIATELGWGESFREVIQRLERLRSLMEEAAPVLREECAELLDAESGEKQLQGWVSAGRSIRHLQEELDGWFEDWTLRPIDQWTDEIQRFPDRLDELPDFLEALRILRDLPKKIRFTLRELDLSHDRLEAEIAESTLQDVWIQNRPSSQFSGKRRDGIQAQLESIYSDWLAANSRRLRDHVRRNLSAAVDLAQTDKREVADELRETRATLSKGLKELQREFKKSRRYRSIRDLVANETGQVIQRMKPVWLMSPLSVSDALPLDPDHFDVVIFDEASQITLEEAIPSLYRAQQAIIVGDEKQMPPTQFFRTRESDDPWEDEEIQESLGLEESSFLSHCGHSLPSTLLGWHYRSRNESLISYSNWSFYSGRLLTAPEESLPQADLSTLDADSAADAQEAISGTLARPISFHFLRHGCYETRRNRHEAEYIAELVRSLLQQADGLTIGIVAFSEAQQEEIEASLHRLAKRDPEFQEALEKELDREDEGQFCGLLVKNLENIQGDERDIVIMSVCYGPNPEGKFRMNFGPINQAGGEKRLNVAFSRAKHHMVVVSSIRGEAITNDYNPGALAFKNYLLYADAMSRGKIEMAKQILQSGEGRQGEVGADSWLNGVVEPLSTWLEDQGYLVDRNVGQSRFKCHLAVRCPGDNVYRLGILIDGKSYYGQKDLLERDLMRPKLLRDFGWRVAVVLAADWWQQTDAIKSELLARLESPHPADEQKSP